MSSSAIEGWFRRFLLLVAGGMALVTQIELILAEHTEDSVQLVPFALCALALASVAAVLLRPGRTSIRALQAMMALVALGSLLGVYEHFEANWGFAREIQPNAATGATFIAALSGASPLLAPGILVLMALLATAATYRRPALERNER